MHRSTRHVLTLLIGLAGLLIVAACGAPEQPTPTTFDLEVVVAGAGTGTVTSDVGDISVTSGDDPTTTTFEAGTTVTLTATAAEGSTFNGWTGPCSGTGTCEITLDADATVTATFGIETPDTATLTVATSGSGTGNVTSSPIGIDLDAGEDSFEYAVGTLVTLTATADDGFEFGGWLGGDCSGTGTCVVEVTTDITVTADFFHPENDVDTEEFFITQGSDDAEEFLSFVNEFYDEGGTTVTSSDLDLTWDTTFNVEIAAVGLRYTGVDLPSNAVVTNATITFWRQSSTNPGSLTLDFVAQADDNAPTFEDGEANFNITNRDTTTESVAWPWSGPWTTETATSPDLSSIVSEVLQRDGWSSGNALAFIITSENSDESNYRNAHSYESDPARAPRLEITYYVPTAP